MRLLLIITILATILRSYILLDFAQECCGSDEGIYHSLALNFSKTGEFFVTQKDEPRIWNNIIYGAKPPLYPLYLAIIYTASGVNYNDYNVAKVVQILTSALTGIFVYLVSKELFNKKIALIALIFYSFFLETAFVSVMLLSENLYWLLLLSLVYALIKIKKNGNRLEVLAGIILGLLILTRPTAIIFILPIIVWLLFRNLNLKSIGRVVLLILFLLITLLPWNVRNYKIYNQFVFSYTDGGMNFWMGNHVGSGGTYRVPKESDPTQVPILKTTGTKKEIERDNFYYNQAFSFIQNYPIIALDLAGRKIFNTFTLYRPVTLNYVRARGQLASIRPKSLSIDALLEQAISYQYAILIISFFFTLAYLIKTSRLNIFICLPILLILCHLFSIVASHYEFRYIVQFYPLLIIISAPSIYIFWRSIFRKNLPL